MTAIEPQRTHLSHTTQGPRALDLADEIETPNAYSTRRVPRDAMRWLVADPPAPRSGDLVLARVTRLGHHQRLHCPSGRRRRLFVGDTIVVAYADRYAPQQFESVVPEDLGECDLVAGGGIASRVVSRHARIRRGATRIAPLGLLAHAGHGAPINLADFALPRLVRASGRCTPTLAVVGTAMDSGKTTTAANVVRGLRRYGLRAAYAKVTGTAAACDPNLLEDAGASSVLDFTDVGFASTYRVSAPQIESIFTSLVGHLESDRPDAIIIEVADGILQEETAALVSSECFRRQVDGILFAANDALGAVGGCGWLRERGLHPAALTGTLEAAPLQAQEAAAATGVPVLPAGALADAEQAAALLHRVASAEGLRS